MYNTIVYGSSQLNNFKLNCTECNKLFGTFYGSKQYF